MGQEWEPEPLDTCKFELLTPQEHARVSKVNTALRCATEMGAATLSYRSLD